MKYQVGDLLFVEAGSWLPQTPEEFYIVKCIDHSDDEEEYSYILHSITHSETEYYINKNWVERWCNKIG